MLIRPAGRRTSNRRLQLDHPAPMRTCGLPCRFLRVPDCSVVLEPYYSHDLPPFKTAPPVRRPSETLALPQHRTARATRLPPTPGEFSLGARRRGAGRYHVSRYGQERRSERPQRADAPGKLASSRDAGGLIAHEQELREGIAKTAATPSYVPSVREASPR